MGFQQSSFPFRHLQTKRTQVRVRFALVKRIDVLCSSGKNCCRGFDQIQTSRRIGLLAEVLPAFLAMFLLRRGQRALHGPQDIHR